MTLVTAVAVCVLHFAFSHAQDVVFNMPTSITYGEGYTTFTTFAVTSGVQQISASVTWNDQGWGLQKGYIAMQISRADAVIYTNVLFGVAPHTSSTASMSEANCLFDAVHVVAGDEIILYQYSGYGGGTHTLTVDSLTFNVWWGTSSTCPPTPTQYPTTVPTPFPTAHPSSVPTADPTSVPTSRPSSDPTVSPTMFPTTEPTNVPSSNPSAVPTLNPTKDPTADPTSAPTRAPSVRPTPSPTFQPTVENAGNADRDSEDSQDITPSPTTFEGEQNNESLQSRDAESSFGDAERIALYAVVAVLVCALLMVSVLWRRGRRRYDRNIKAMLKSGLGGAMVSTVPKIVLNRMGETNEYADVQAQSPMSCEMTMADLPRETDRQTVGGQSDDSDSDDQNGMYGVDEAGQETHGQDKQDLNTPA